MSLAVIIDYGSGNLRSAQKAFERAARERGADMEIRVSADPDDVRKAARIVLPGVGAFRDCRAGLHAVPGLRETLQEEVIGKAKPFLGICVGMQLMADLGREHEVTQGLGWIAGEVRAITPSDPALKIPHMGWNTLDVTNPHALFNGIPLGPDGLHAYFVHSYAMYCARAEDCLAVTNHGGTITAAIGRDNMAGTQFHPEKSQALGLAFIGNFLEWRP
ncbi:MAG: imidazole glycerol phosphate synthase subunit HisH [Aestuariivirgaceae bacterium]|nr:imidazole glycerol phosphate synthase subunit HisH [Aestuariivirgaceae bacterium]